MPTERNKPTCCEMRLKVSLGIARVHPEDECGISDSVMVDFHDFDYRSNSSLPVSSALTFKYCPWCGADRRNVHDSDRRTVEVIRPC